MVNVPGPYGDPDSSGFCTPATVKAAPVVPAGSEHAAPLRVIVTVWPDVTAEPTEHTENPLVSATVGGDEIPKFGSKVADNFDPAASPPVLLASKVTANVEMAFPVAGVAPKLTLAGGCADVMVTPLAGEAARVSLAVATVNAVLAIAPVAAGLASPVRLRLAAVLLASAQPVPARVIVTVWPDPAAVGLQVPVKPEVNATPGVVGTTNPAGNTAVIALLPAVVLSAPPALVVKPSVQRPTALAAVDRGENVTALGELWLITTGPAGDAFTLFELVCTRKVVLVMDPAAGLVMPATESVAAVLAGSVHGPPLSASVIVTVRVAVTAEPTEQLGPKPLSSVTVGEAATVKPVPNVAVMVDAPINAPAVVEVKPTVHVDGAFALCGEPANVTAVGATAVVMTTFEPTCTVFVSDVVLTV
jgi:hypothetical protein